MLMLPILLGVAASRPDAWQLAVMGVAISGYLLSATLQAWARARRSPVYRAPILAYGAAFAVLGVLLAWAFPILLVAGVVVGPTAVIVFEGARPGTRRDLANSLAQVAQALVLLPVAAYVSGHADPGRVATYGLVAAAYLAGSVLVVRSVLRERGNGAFARGSIATHLAMVVAALLLLPPAGAVVAAWLAARAAALPLLQRRWAGGPRPLRPIHVGLVEIVSSLAVVAVAFAVRL